MRSEWCAVLTKARASGSPRCARATTSAAPRRIAGGSPRIGASSRAIRSISAEWFTDGPLKLARWRRDVLRYRRRLVHGRRRVLVDVVRGSTPPAFAPSAPEGREATAAKASPTTSAAEAAAGGFGIAKVEALARCLRIVEIDALPRARVEMVPLVAVAVMPVVMVFVVFVVSRRLGVLEVEALPRRGCIGRAFVDSRVDVLKLGRIGVRVSLVSVGQR